MRAAIEAPPFEAAEAEAAALEATEAAVVATSRATWVAEVVEAMLQMNLFKK